MRFTKLFLLGVAGLTFASCSHENVGTSTKTNGANNENKAYASLYLKLQNPAGSRAVVPDGGYYEGNANENTVSSLKYLQGASINKTFSLLNAAPADFTTGANEHGGDFWASGTVANGAAYRTGVWQTTPENATTMGLIVNHEENSLVDGSRAFKTEEIGSKGNEVADIAAIAKATKFLMTSEVLENRNIESNVSKEVAIAGTKNNFDFEVERVAVKGIVYHGQNGDYTVENRTGMVKHDGMTFAALQGGVKTFLFKNTAGALGIAGNTAGFESAIHTFGAVTEPTDDVSDNLIRLGNLRPSTGTTFTNNDLGGYKAIDVNAANTATDAPTIGALNGIYFLENSLQTYNSSSNATGFYRYAYAKVYTTFVPAVAYTYESKYYFATDNQKAGLVDASGAAVNGSTNDIYYLGTNTQYSSITLPTGKESTHTHIYVKKVKSTAALAEGTTFYYNESTGHFYKDMYAAYIEAGLTELTKLHADNDADATAARAKFYTYTDGKCAYRALWNRYEDPQVEGVVKNADVRRNTIYALEIAGFKKIGMPWDKSDPNDPNLKKPDNGEGSNPPGNDPNVDHQQTYMTAKASILHWFVKGRSVTFN